MTTRGPDAVVFDLDGILVATEELWEAVRRDIVSEAGGRWRPGAQAAMSGMNAPEWSAYMRDKLGVARPTEWIAAETIRRLIDVYRRELPVLRGAPQAVGRLARRVPLALASSSPHPVIAEALGAAGIAGRFGVVVSSDDVPHGKPDPAVYVEAARLLGVAPERCAAVEDSGNGIRAAAAAGMTVVAIPNASFPPPPEALAEAHVVLPSITALWPAVLGFDGRMLAAHHTLREDG